jgi:hypothetical protein
MVFTNHFTKLNVIGEVHVPKSNIWYYLQKILSKSGGKSNTTCMIEVYITIQFSENYCKQSQYQILRTKSRMFIWS